jgi:hypothetical protein
MLQGKLTFPLVTTFLKERVTPPKAVQLLPASEFGCDTIKVSARKKYSESDIIYMKKQ